MKSSQTFIKKCYRIFAYLTFSLTLNLLFPHAFTKMWFPRKTSLTKQSKLTEFNLFNTNKSFHVLIWELKPLANRIVIHRRAHIDVMCLYIQLIVFLIRLKGCGSNSSDGKIEKMLSELRESVRKWLGENIRFILLGKKHRENTRGCEKVSQETIGVCWTRRK